MRILRLISASIAISVVASIAWADAQFDRLHEALKIDAYVQITRQEGLVFNAELANEMLSPDSAGVAAAQIDRLYDVTRMRATVTGKIEDIIDRENLDLMLLFLTSETGRRILDQELAARRALQGVSLEPGSEEEGLVKAMRASMPDRAQQIDDLVAAFDLVDRNVTGSLNSQMLFFKGLNSQRDATMSEEDILRETWALEGTVREDTILWVEAYSWLAYRDLSDQDMDDYIIFAKTPPGQALNRALFEGFNALYDELSFGTGRIFALNGQSSDL